VPRARRLPFLQLLPLLTLATPAGAQIDHLELKWIRDSEEFVAIFRQTYALAARAVEAQTAAVPRGTPWAVVLDVDETVLDNSPYQLERAAFRLPYDTASWNAWVRRERAEPLPGVRAFLDGVRRLGGRVVFITNRDDGTADETRRNLAAHGLWTDHDRLCPQTADRAYSKRARREELRTGTGACAYAGQAVRVLAYLGDNIADIPEADEEPGELGVHWFVLPNPAYGSWERRTTRGTRLR
jgi:5'-nucleotidase (lipoprotein e(P4) family)